MTRKTFIALADHLKDRYDGNKSVCWNEVLRLLADFCQSQNPAFKRERWIGYVRGECGPGGGTVK
jgi:hypothetical protein